MSVTPAAPIAPTLTLPRVVDVPSLTEADVRALQRWFRVLNIERGELRGKALAQHWLKIVHAIQRGDMSEGRRTFWEITESRLSAFVREEKT